ncbi:MAG: glycine cleavage system aminomethyltransferase GcvT [Coleofasciculaceae cyanobacterium RL_1_1]|nr:glycine cleavage system aminomethyltransferase GcvT [Coleofasciculaceae cyanobacterium RL_1_1]
MLPTPPAPLSTPLHSVCSEAGAKFTPFSGWLMPVQFAGIRQEHEAVRTAAGLFDISHMGKFVLQGKEAIAQLQTLVPSNLDRLTPGQAQYTVLLDETGGILDDLIIYDCGRDPSGDQRVVLIVNAGTCDADRAWIKSHLDLETVTLTDLTHSHVLIAIQGPQAAAQLQPLITADLSEIPTFGHRETTLFGQPAFVARTGYTGEDGFEVMVEPPVGKLLWLSLCEAGVSPCGLGARDTLRLEAAMALYGSDIDRTTSPLEAGLTWVVHRDKSVDYIGRSAIEAQQREGIPRRLVGLQMQGRHIARHGYPVIVDGVTVGAITSGAPSQTLGYPIALAYVPLELAKLGTVVDVEIRGKTHPAIVVKKPFYRRSET